MESKPQIRLNASAGTPTRGWTAPLLIVFALWVIVLFDPHIWLASYGVNFLVRIPPFIFVVLAIVTVLHPRGRVWYTPFLLFVAGASVMIPFAYNTGFVRELILKVLLLYYILAIGTRTFVDSVHRTTLLFYLFLWQFLWWSFHARMTGSVPWHPDLGNDDAFGAFMVLGVGYCYHFAMSAQKRTLRLAAFSVFGLCLFGVVSSHARGSVLAAGLVLLFVCFRSPRRGRSFVVLVVGVVLVLVISQMFFPRYEARHGAGGFWEEMGTLWSGGVDAEIREGRGLIWREAWRAFLMHPIFGVGAGNFGSFASENFSEESELARYFSAATIWRWNLHSAYFQVLAEMGLVGTTAVAALLIDFWKRNARLRSARLRDEWLRATGNAFDLRALSLGLEAAMLGFIATAVFYNQLYVHWLYSILTLNATLHDNAERIAARPNVVRPQ